METLRRATKLLALGSPQALAAILLVGVVLLFLSPRYQRWGRWWLASVVLVLILLMLQGTSDLLVGGLGRGFHSLRSVGDASGATVVVVLSNGVRSTRTGDQELSAVNLQTAFNALEAARVYRLLGDPVVLASGGSPFPGRAAPEGQTLGRALVLLGVPAPRIEVEGRSGTTYEQVLGCADWLNAHAVTTFVLVTSPEHMRRAVGVFRAQGLSPIPSPSKIQYGGSPFWRPTSYAFEGSVSAVYEYLAIGFYWWRHWM